MKYFWLNNWIYFLPGAILRSKMLEWQRSAPHVLPMPLVLRIPSGQAGLVSGGATRLFEYFTGILIHKLGLALLAFASRPASQGCHPYNFPTKKKNSFAMHSSYGFYHCICK
jgi:hypothetical protein